MARADDPLGPACQGVSRHIGVTSHQGSEYACLAMSLGYRLRGALPASLLVCAACALAPGAAAAGTLDQQQAASSGSGHFIDSTHGVAQSFTAGISGGLDQVDLMLQKFGGPSAYLSVEIRDLAGGTPGGLILAGRSVPASSIPTSQGLVSVHFAPAAPVLAGTPYAI